MGELEHLAYQHGRSRLRLDTRSDLVEARRLYERLGYREVPPFNEGKVRRTLVREDTHPTSRGPSPNMSARCLSQDEDGRSRACPVR